MIVEGVSTRRVDDLVRSLGCEGISKSQVSRICSELDTVVTSFLGRPLDSGPYRYLWLDALTQRVREEGRIAQVSVVVATAVNVERPKRPASHLTVPGSARCWASTSVPARTGPSGWHFSAAS